MDTDTPQPRETKEWLVEHGLRVLTTKYRRELARDLLLGGTALPAEWLTPRQQHFLDLHPGAMLNAGLRRTGVELLGRAIYLCDRLIPWLVDDYLDRHPLDPDARKILRRRAAVLVRDVLLRTCASWPSADMDGWESRVRPAVDEALSRGRASAAPATGDRGVLIRPAERPADQRDLDEKLIIWATSEEALSRRVSRHLWEQEARRAVRVAVALVAAGAIAVLYLVLFAALRYVQPNLPVREAVLVVGAAIGAALGGTGLGLLGQTISARWGRDRPAAEASPARSGDADPVRPEAR